MFSSRWSCGYRWSGCSRSQGDEQISFAKGTKESNPSLGCHVEKTGRDNELRGALLIATESRNLEMHEGVGSDGQAITDRNASPLSVRKLYRELSLGRNNEINHFLALCNEKLPVTTESSWSGLLLDEGVLLSQLFSRVVSGVLNVMQPVLSGQRRRVAKRSLIGSTLRMPVLSWSVL